MDTYPKGCQILFLFLLLFDFYYDKALEKQLLIFKKKKKVFPPAQLLMCSPYKHTHMSSTHSLMSEHRELTMSSMLPLLPFRLAELWKDFTALD